MSEKTHEPSLQRLREARRQGNIPRSRLFTSAAVTVGGLAGTLVFASDTAAHLMGWTARTLALGAVRPEESLAEGLRVLTSAALPTLLGAMAGAMASAVLSAGLEVNVAHVAPKLERVDLLQGLEKLLSLKQVVEVLKGLVVATIIGWLMWRGVSDAGPAAFKVLGGDAAPGFATLLALLQPLVMKAGGLLLALGAADFALARRRHRKDLMMSREEAKQEHKTAEGDPHQKSKRKALHKQLAQGGTARGMHKATAVVVNPTHIAVALRYDDGECDAPYLVAKGRDEDAMFIRKEAQRLGIPIVKDIPLARALVHYDLGEEVPEELYRAAAAVLKVALETSAGRDASPTRETP